MDAKRVILDMKYARIIELLAKRLKVSSEEAMDRFYNSPLFELIDAGVADLHCRSDEYLVEEIIHTLGPKECVGCRFPDGYPFSHDGCFGCLGLGCIGDGPRCCKILHESGEL